MNVYFSVLFNFYNFYFTTNIVEYFQWPGSHPASYEMITWGSFPGREADQSLPSSVEVKTALRYTSTPPIRLHGVVFSWAQEQL